MRAIDFSTSLFIFVSFVMTSAQSAWGDSSLRYPNLSKEGLAEVMALGEKIFQECPPEKCLPIFVGRSSVLISAYLEAAKGYSSVLLPLSGLASLPEDLLGEAEKKFSEFVLTPFLESSLKSNAYESIRVIDYVNGGNTIERVSGWIDTFVSKTSPGVQVSAITYGGSLSSEAQKRLRMKGVPFMSMPLGSQTEGHLRYLIKNSMLEIYAPYAAWQPLTENASPKIERNMRKPYVYRDGPGSPTTVASYQDLVTWLKDEKLSEKLPSSVKLFCDNATKHAGKYQDFTN